MTAYWSAVTQLIYLFLIYLVQILIGELTHDGNVVLDQQRGFLSALLQNAHRLRQRAAMETDPINAQQSITRLDRSFSRGRERGGLYGGSGGSERPVTEVSGHSPVSWTPRPDVCYDDGARLVPVLMSTACAHTRARVKVRIIPLSHTNKRLTSDDEAEAVSLSM